MHHTGGHGEGRNSRRADHGVDFLLQEQIHQFRDHHAAHGVHHEGDQSKSQNQQRLYPQELRRVHPGGDGQPQQNGNQVRQHVLRRLRQGIQHAALPDQIPEHEKSDQRHGLGRDEPHDDRHRNGEQDFRGLGDGATLVGHFDLPLRLGGTQANHRRLHHRHQRHVGVGRHHNGRRVAGTQLLGDENGGRAVRRADDGDRGRVVELKSQQGRQPQGEENTELCRRAEDHQLGICQQRLKIDHRADADEQQQRKQLMPRDAELKQMGDDPRRAGIGQVHQNRAEAHGQQQRRLHLLDDGKINQRAADDPHKHLLPCQKRQVFYKHFHK